MKRVLRGVFFAIAVATGIAHAQTAPPPPRAIPPVMIGEPDVAYPDDATGEATVMLIIIVEADGTVRSAIAESGEEPFASAAAEAAKSFRFTPATRDGTPMPAKIRIAIRFRPPEIVEEPPSKDAPPAKPPPPRAPVGVEEVIVRGEREPGRTVTLSRNEVRQIPGTFGDPFRALEMMPGVTPVVSGLPFFFVRGAPPGNVGYFLDGVRVPLLFHVGAGPSVVHPGLVDRVDLYPGGYPAKFGRFSGGIVSGETLPPGKKTRGELNARLFDVGALVETPIGTKGTLLYGGRYSYTGALLTQVSPETILDYWDYQVRATYDVTPEDQIGVFAFGSYDYLGQRTPTQTLTVFGTEFHRVDLRYDRKLADRGKMRVGATLGQDRTRLNEDRYLRNRMVAARTDLSWILGSAATLRMGTDLQMDAFEVELVQGILPPTTARLVELLPSRTDLAFGTRADVVLGVAPGFEITPGARVDLYSSQGATALGADPRLAMRAAISPKARVLSAMGIAHQTPSFVVPVPGFQPGGLKGGLQKAIQESVGVEVDLFESTTASMTVFHNGFLDMSDPLGTQAPQLSGCPPGTFPSGSIAGDRGGQPTNAAICGQPRFAPGTIGPDRSGGGGQASETATNANRVSAFEVRSSGRSYGLELFLKRKLTSRVGGFVAYTLSRSIRRANDREYVAAFDRTHVLNAAIAFDLGRSWRAGTRVMFYTGLPKAPDPTDDSTRLPPFYRLDLRLEKRWQLDRTVWVSFVAEWLNATLTKEAVATTCTLQGCQAQTIGPVTIPSLGLEGGF